MSRIFADLVIWHGAFPFPPSTIPTRLPMKTRGIENAIRRLQGARKMQSPFLIAKAEEEARHILTQSRAWLARAPVQDERHALVAEAARELAAVIGGPGGRKQMPEK
jgi:hypothetical protein